MLNQKSISFHYLLTVGPNSFARPTCRLGKGIFSRPSLMECIFHSNCFFNYYFYIDGCGVVLRTLGQQKA